METTTKFLEKRNETHDSISFIFAKPAGFDYIAGQYAFFTVDHESPDARGNRRHFTLSSSPTEPHLCLTTKFSNPCSTYKEALRNLNPDTEVPIRGPEGDFTLPEDQSQPLVFLGGGIGITPFRSMIKFATDTHLPTPITLIYANKTPADIVYRTEFDQWAETNPNFQVHYTVDTPNETWTGDIGHLTSDMIKKYAPDLDKPIYFICGPLGMLTAYEKILQETGIDEDQIRTESFSGYS